MTRYWRYAAVALAAVAAAVLWPLTPALVPSVALTARIASAAATVLVCAVIATWNAGRRAILAIVAVCGGIGLALLLLYVDAQSRCLADYDGRPVIIGTAYTPLGQKYVASNPLDTNELRLLDVAGDRESIWTADSIRRCTLLVSWPGVGALPFLAASAAVLLRRRPFVLPARRAEAPSPATGTASPVYDAFLSYRHVDADRTIAFELLETLERQGLHLAIDARDFSPNEHFLSEMERCIKQSRFVLCVVTSQYVQSEHTSEEAIISKTLDLAERRRRLVPLIFERVDLPVWLHGLVGIDFTAAAGVDPHERLAHLLARA